MELVRIIEKDDKSWLLYERRIENKRNSLKLPISRELNIEDEVQRLMKKVNEKYYSD